MTAQERIVGAFVDRASRPRGARAAGLVTALALAMLVSTVCNTVDAFGQDPGQTCPPEALFSQPPNLGGEGWEIYVSDSVAGYFRYEAVRSISAPVCGVRWWGLHATDSGTGFVECDDNPGSFRITFYGDSQSRPGAVVCSYAVEADGKAVGEVNGWVLYQYQASLDPCCALTDGWVSVMATDGIPSCWFFWNSSPVGDDSACQRNPINGLVCGTGQHYRDLSLCLTDFPVSVKPSAWGAIKSLYRNSIPTTSAPLDGGVFDR